MLGIHEYGLFVIAGVLLALVPGQDTMFIISRSLTGGLRSGIGAALGVSSGCVCHTVMATLGLSAVLAASPAAFTAVKLLGAIYLAYLGIRLLRKKNAADEPQTVSPASGPAGAWSSPFVQGLLTNVLNPKVALFFLAFLPQFIDPASTTKTLAFLFLGATFIAIGTIWCLVLAIGAARLRSLFLRRPAFRTLIDRAAGVLFLALGARLAWAR